MSILKIKDGFKGERSLIMPEMILSLAKEDPVLRTLHITDIGYYPHATHHYRERTEPIDQYVLIYCVKGSGKYSVEGPITVSANISSRIADRNNIFEDIFLTLSDGYTIENLRYTASMLHFYLGSLRYLPLYRKYHKKEMQNEGEIQTVINASLKFMEENV